MATPIDPALLAELAEKAVLEASKLKRNGARKHRHATKLVARQIDALLIWPTGPVGLIAEALDGVAALLIASIVQNAFEKLRKRGEV